MAPATRPRGPGDTALRVPRVERAFKLALAVALLLHLPLVPIPAFFAWFGPVGDYDDADAQAIVPIDLDLLARDPVPDPAPAPPPPSPAPPAPAATGGGAADAGAPPHDAGAPPDAGAPKEKADAGPAPLVDPTRVAGGAGKISAKDPNVQILISGKVLRKHPIGAWASRLLVAIPKWRPFFEGSPLDPIRDVDHFLITAPRLKEDSSKLVAVLEYNVSPDLARDAVDRMLQHTNGVWVEDAALPVARANVGGAARLFALVPNRRLLVVLPVEAMDQVAHLKQAKGFRNSAEGVVVSMLTPSRPFKGSLPLPETLKWLRLALTPTADGGVDLAIDAGDRSHEEAVVHAGALTQEIEVRRKVSVLGLASYEIIDPVTFTADGDVIRARSHVSPQRTRVIMDWIEQQAQARDQAR